MAVKYYILGTSKEKTDFFQSNWVGEYGHIPDVRGVVWHDSASGINANISDTVKYTINHMDSANYHWAIDYQGNCQAVVSEDVGAYHCANSYGNQYYLSLENVNTLTGGSFASSSDRDKFRKCEDWGAKLTADICVKYGLNENQVYRHNTLSSTSCPYTAYKDNGNSYSQVDKSRRAKIKKYIKQIKNGGQEEMEYKYYFQKHKVEGLSGKVDSNDAYAFKPMHVDEHEKAYMVHPYEEREIYLDGELTEASGHKIYPSTAQMMYPTKTITKDGKKWLVMKVEAVKVSDDIKQKYVYVPYRREV